MTRPAQLGAIEPVISYRVRLPFIPTSSKNRNQIRRHGRRISIAKSDQAEAHQAAIAAIATQLLRGQPPGETLLGGNYFSVDVVVDAAARCCLVYIHDLGPPPPGRRPKWTDRDVHGILETILDGMQGVVFDDDRQNRDGRVRWGVVE